MVAVFQSWIKHFFAHSKTFDYFIGIWRKMYWSYKYICMYVSYICIGEYVNIVYYLYVIWKVEQVKMKLKHCSRWAYPILLGKGIPFCSRIQYMILMSALFLPNWSPADIVFPVDPICSTSGIGISIACSIIYAFICLSSVFHPSVIRFWEVYKLHRFFPAAYFFTLTFDSKQYQMQASYSLRDGRFDRFSLNECITKDMS